MKSYADRERARLWALLGDLPRIDAPPTLVGSEPIRTSTYRLDRLVLDLNGGDPVPALFARPVEGDGPFPVLLYNHAHGGDYELGKRELVDGRAALEDPPYADVLTERGWAVLAIDHWAFGERQGHGEQHIFSNMLWDGRVMWGMMLYDSLRALDYLVTREDVDARRIGTIGISMGSTMGWWLAALDERVAVCVDICCLTEFHTFTKTPACHGVYYYVPSLLRHFTTGEINALIAPRSHLSLAGLEDPLTPPEGLDIVDRDLRRAYAACDAADRWKLSRYPVGHEETAGMRSEALEWLDRWL